MSSQTERLSAALAGRYRIERELGAGGMAGLLGEVRVNILALNLALDASSSK